MARFYGGNHSDGIGVVLSMYVFTVLTSYDVKNRVDVVVKTVLPLCSFFNDGKVNSTKLIIRHLQMDKWKMIICLTLSCFEIYG